MLDVFRFECRYQLRSPLFGSVALVWFLLGFFIMASENVSVGSVANNLNLNAAHSIISIQYVLCIIGMFAAVAFVASAITRDYETRTAELFFATGIGARSYLLGRFLGGTLFATLAVLAGVFGTLAGSFMPWLDTERLGAFSAAPYTYSVVAVVLPNMFVICALFFCVAALSRSMIAAYLAALGFLVTFVVVANNTDPASMDTLALAGPFGQVAFAEITRYWTVAERNLLVPGLSGTLLYNRLIWLSIALVALAGTTMGYRFKLAGNRGGARETRAQAAPVLQRFDAAPDTGSIVVLRQFLSQVRMDIRGITRSAPFYILLAFGMFNVIGGFIVAMSAAYGTPVYPVTQIVSQVVGSNFSFVVLLILIFYAGELVHRERTHRVAEYVDAAPFPSGVMAAAKVAALWFVITALFGTVILVGMVLQAVNGYTNFQPGLYLVDVLGVIGGSFYFWAVIAVLVQVLSPGKFAGMLVTLLIFLGMNTLVSFGFEHVLYSLSLPNAPYSAMNGYGHFLQPLFTVALYLTGLGVLVFIATHLLYPRGLHSASQRIAGVRARFSPAVRQTAVLAVVATSAVGGWIYYNTVVLNEYKSTDDREAEQAAYEKAYRAYLDAPLPAVKSLALEVNLVPEERRLESSGQAILVNDTQAPIAELPVSMPPQLHINALTIEGGEQVFADEELGFYRFELAEPLAPSGQLTMSWDLTWSHQGFENSGSSTRLVHNGTFVNNTEIMPIPGYDRSRELQDNNVRREHDLPGVIRMAELEDAAKRKRSAFGSRRSAFKAIVSTAPDQIAVAPGYLKREWEDGGRRYFEYAMDEPIWPFVSIVSARYEVVDDVWVNPDTGAEVALSVLFDPQHEYNVQRMLEGSKKSLDYFNAELSPYQYRQFRILEFPGYERFAQSFPNTIPFSEAIGFIADLRDPAEIDYVFYVTAHEMAHQWWGHQVAGADVQGQTFLVETLAQYSALMVMEHEYGAQHMRRFLKYELDRYLRSRGGELIEELPLMRVENQGYIHYRKGSVAMYALKDAIGEDRVNEALRRFIEKYGFNENDYPTSRDLIAEFRAVAPVDQQELITDLFEKITLFDLAVSDVTVAEVDGEYEVSLTVEARKFYADGTGVETEAPLDMALDLGVFPAIGDEQRDELGEDDLPEPLYLQKHSIVSGTQQIRIRVPDRPARIGIDPYSKMIDRNPDDNLSWL